jgi:hypothetical protein
LGLHKEEVLCISLSNKQKAYFFFWKLAALLTFSERQSATMVRLEQQKMIERRVPWRGF